MHMFARWMMFVFLGLVSAHAATSYFDEQRASGVWVFDLFASDGEDFVTAPLEEAAKMICAEHPCVKGFSTRISWRNIEPEEGKFDWRYTDRMFEIAEKYDKLVALRVIGWENWEKKEASPMWLWNKVTHYMDLNTTWQEVTRLPYLGKNTEFLRYWLRLNRALGERYAGHPRLQRIHMSTGYDQEMYYIKNLTPAQVQSFCPAGTAVLVKDLLEHWHETFLCYKQAFPGKAFVLDLSAPIQGVEGVIPSDILERVVMDASKVFGAHLYLQQDGLSERNSMAKEVKPTQKSNRSLMISLQEQHLLGFETLLPPQQEGKMPVQPPAKLFIRDLRKTIDAGLSFPVRYLEFWVATLKDPATLPDIQHARAELEKRVALTADRANDTSPMKGLYWRVDWSYMREPLRNGDYLKDVAGTLSSNSCLEGVFIGFGWNDIEPKPGEYNWKFVDSVVELVRRYGKKYKLSAKAGIRTPEWVYKEGAQAFSYEKTKGPRGVLKNPRPNKIPIPWDPIYLKDFTRFVERMGERYGKDNHCVAVTISGANSQSAEMHLPKEPKDVAKWESLGDYKGRIVTVWQQMIDTFAGSFPKQQICLHIAMPIFGMETELKTITDYGVRKYPEQFTAQNCQLSGKSDQSQSAVYQLISEVKDKVHHGFQNVGSWTNPGPHEQGNFEMSVLNYTGADAEYLELAYDDGMNQSLCRRFLDEVAKAREMGHEKYKASLIQSGKYVAGTGRKNKNRSMPK